MNLHKTSSKLAGLYLAIIMFISLSFSISNYQLSLNEIRQSFRGQANFIERNDDLRSVPRIRDELKIQRDEQYKELKNRILSRLIVVNIFILIGGGVLSYYLARRTIKPIEDAKEAQIRFVADASHELKTPLTVMRSEIEVILMDKKMNLGSAKHQLESNLEEVKKLTDLSEGLLQLARFEQNDIQKQNIKLKNLVNESTKNFKLPAKEHGNKITVDNIPAVQISGNKSALLEAINILLDNAIKYSDSGSEIIINSAIRKDKIAISISNKGQGIKPKDLQHIFERFYRVDDSRSKQNSVGYGLGLAIAKNIVDRHNGTLSAESIPGAITTFTIELPTV